MTAWTKEGLIKHFRFYEDVHTPPVSPLYTVICRGICEDDALLSMAADATPGQPAANLILAAVQYLLLFEDPDPALARFYPTLTDRPDAPESAYQAFHDYCIRHEARIRALVSTRRTNTNEVGRCACLLPAFHLVSDAVKGRALTMIELGPSAGLNLLWDRFFYDYGEGRTIGDADSAVRIGCAAEGDLPLGPGQPAVADRCGLEISPVDLRDLETRRWLRALIWPEQVERTERLDAAIALALADPEPVRAGDAAALLPGLLAEAPEGEPVCVYHSLVHYQMPDTVRAMIDDALRAAARTRPVFRIAYEGTPGPDCAVAITRYHEDAASARHALCHPHGTWLTWHATPEPIDGPVA